MEIAEQFPCIPTLRILPILPMIVGQIGNLPGKQVNNLLYLPANNEKNAEFIWTQSVQSG